MAASDDQPALLASLGGWGANAADCQTKELTHEIWSFVLAVPVGAAL